MNESDSVNPPELPPRRALRHHVVQRLLKAIITGELTAGTRLITSKLAIRFGVSATPIREALVELEQSGIIELSHHCGALVRPFGRKEVRDFYAVRRLLECESVRLACSHVDDELLSSLRSDLQRLIDDSGSSEDKWTNDLLGVDRRIHGMTIDHCGNKRLVAEIERDDTFSQAMRDFVEYDRQRHKESIVPLVDLLDAMRQHRAEAGAVAMGRHINLVSATVESVMFDENKDREVIHPGPASGPETQPQCGGDHC